MKLLKATFLCAALILLSSQIHISVSALSQSPHGFDLIINNVNKTLINEHVEFFSTDCEPRITGYSGFFRAADYIAKKFSEYGVQPYEEEYFEYFNVTVPVELGCSITLEDGTQIKAYMLLPNNVATCGYESPTDGDTLIHVKTESLAALGRADVKGKFVLLDFNSRWLFRLLAMYGAKGVIFVPEDESLTTRPEAEQKLLLIPLHFPRLYVPLNEGQMLAKLVKEHAIKVFIKANMLWESIKVPNIVGYIKGTDKILSREAIVISAYYDSYSVVPNLSPGATDSLGISVLLEFARLMAKNPPARSIFLLATAGHWQSLWGAREFVDRHFNEIGTKMVAFAGIDLSTDTETTGIFATGSAYQYMYPSIVNSRYGWLTAKFFNEYLNELKMILGSKYGETFVDGILLTSPVYIQGFPAYDPGATMTLFRQISTQYSLWSRGFNNMFDSEPFMLACYGSAFTYRTTNAFRHYQKTPMDTYERINFHNLWPQVSFIYCTLWGLLNERTIRLYRNPLRVSDDWGYATLAVQVSEYNLTTGYYDLVTERRRPDLWKDVIVHFYTPTPNGFFTVIAKIDKNGEAIIHGLKPYQMGFAEAFVVNKTGHIEWATDIGIFQAPGSKNVYPTSANFIKLVSIFPCASIGLLFSFDPSEFRFLNTMLVYDARAHGPMIHQNSLLFDAEAIAFVQPKLPAEILLLLGEKLPIIMSINATRENPAGKGYTLNKGDSIILGLEDFAKDIFFMSNARYYAQKSRFAYAPTTDLYHKYASSYESELVSYEKEILGCSYKTFAFSRFLYQSVMDLMGQIVSTLSFFFIISILCVFILYGLLFSGIKGRMRLLSIPMFIITQLGLAMIHPAYIIATNAFVNLLSVSMMIVIVILALIIANEAISSAKQIREKVIGLHFTEISRAGLATQAIFTGLSNMKKRKFRTVLTFVSLTILVFAMVSFASITISPRIIETGLGEAKPAYQGILIKYTIWRALPEEVYMSIKSFMADKALVAPRAWLYAPPLPPGAGATGGQPLIMFTAKRITIATSLLALSPEEANISGIDRLLTDGRWFNDSDVFSVVLPEKIVSSLSTELDRDIRVNSTITLWGMELKVVGIINDAKLTNFTDINGERITPADIRLLQSFQPPHYFGHEVLIIPYKLYANLVFPTQVMSIAIKPYNLSETYNLAKDFSLSSSFDVYLATSKGVSWLRTRQWFSLIGMSTAFPPIIIGILTMLSLMLGIVYERLGEIKIYNAIGMSPLHIVMMFLMEPIAYAAPSTFLGYFFGILATSFMIKLGIYPSDLYPNFSSYIMLVVSVLTIGSIISSALYPALKIARLSVPLKEWKWKMTKPEGDVWSMSFPFVAPNETEVFSIFEFLKEYFAKYTLTYGTTISAEKVSYESHKTPEGEEVKQLTTIVRLAPYELGVVQEAIIEATARDDIYNFNLVIKRKSGPRDTWITSNRAFIDVIRKQLLIWREVPLSERIRYLRRWESSLQGGEEKVERVS